MIYKIKYFLVRFFYNVWKVTGKSYWDGKTFYMKVVDNNLIYLHSKFHVKPCTKFKDMEFQSYAVN
jgi:hypothetical protein